MTVRLTPEDLAAARASGRAARRYPVPAASSARLATILGPALRDALTPPAAREGPTVPAA